MNKQGAGMVRPDGESESESEEEDIDKNVRSRFHLTLTIVNPRLHRERPSEPTPYHLLSNHVLRGLRRVLPQTPEALHP